MNTHLPLFILLSVCFGCLESGERNLCTDSTCDELTESRDGYPGYGFDVGDIIAPLEFVNGDGTPFSLSEIYQDGSRKVLIISTSAGWCTACIEEQAALETLYGEYRELGVEILMTVFEKASFEPADARFAEFWKRRYRLTYPVVADPEFKMQDYYPGRDSSVTPIMLIIDVSTMTILERFVGYREQAVRALLDLQLSGRDPE